jgi:hypothetical protein
VESIFVQTLRSQLDLTRRASALHREAEAGSLNALKSQEEKLEGSSNGLQLDLNRLDAKVKKHKLEVEKYIVARAFKSADDFQTKLDANQKSMDATSKVLSQMRALLEKVSAAVHVSESPVHREHAAVAAQALLARARADAASASHPAPSIPIEAEDLACAMLSDRQCGSLEQVQEVLRIFYHPLFASFESLFE